MKHGLTLVLILLGVLAADAQMISVPYNMSFEPEDSVELKNWVINPGVHAPECTDQWIVGSDTYSEGKHSLYISCDGSNAFFGAKPNVQYAYRDFQLPAGAYEISFDWRCVGTNATGLYVGLGLNTCNLEANSVSGAYGTEPEQWLQCGKKMFNGSSLWKNESFSTSVKSGRTLRLFFMWVSTNTDTTLALPVGACIDNIQITSGNCARPMSLEAETSGCDTVLVRWKGTSEQYNLEYRKRGGKRWRVHTGIYNTNYILEGLEEGMYDLRVRGICNQVDTSAYCYLNSFVIFCPERHCINYVNLKDSDNVYTTIGTYMDPYAKHALIDEGYNEPFKRHTVYWEPDVFDPRTGNQLRTIPDGELASVRLGNWQVGAEAESVSYQYTVDGENYAILLLKYAIVMEDPGHDRTNQPRFKLEILDESGVAIDPTCGAADFYADKGRQGWHVNNKTPVPVTWKDWTAIGLNLEAYDGQTLTIRLTTYDCSQSGHYGYAYFTLGCAAAKLYGTSCGDETTMNVNAPDGFDYTWYNKDNKVVCKDKEISILPSDTTTYRCHLSYKESPSCGFDLYTSARPRFPVAEMDYQYVPAECQNKYVFVNKSHIMTKFGGTIEHHYDELCEEYVWDFGDGTIATETNPHKIFPNEGGTYPVKLYAMITDGQCVDSTTFNLVVPKIGDSEMRVDSAICEGQYITLGDKTAIGGQKICAETGIYSVTWKDRAGCDSTLTVSLTLKPVSKVQLPDTTVCAEEPLVVDGRSYRYQYTLKDGDFYLDPYYTNRDGCDSIIWMRVHVLDSIRPEVRMQDIQGDKENSGKLFIGGTGFVRFTVNGVNYPNTVTEIDSLNGGVFELEFFNEKGCSVTVTMTMSSPCRHLIFQRWNDVLSVMNAGAQQRRSPEQKTLNLSTFQWLKDDVEIPGQTLSYYWEEGGLDPNSVYQVRVVTEDGETIVSCPFTPEILKSTAPACRKVIDNQRLLILIDDVRYNAQGFRL